MGNDDERRVIDTAGIGKGIAIVGIWASCTIAVAYGAPSGVFIAAGAATMLIGILF